MKLATLAIPTTTTMQVTAEDGSTLFDENGDVAEVFIHGYTPDAAEYRKAQARIVKPTDTTYRVGKKGRMEFDAKADPAQRDREIRVLAAAVTGIDGLDDFEFSGEAVLEMFRNDGCAYIVEQWREHLNDRGNFSKQSSEKPSKSSKSARG